MTFSIDVPLDPYNPATAEISVDFDDGAATLEVIWKLRDAMERSRRLQWFCIGDLPNEVSQLIVHLPPPVLGGGVAGDLWRSRFAYGLLYYRQGPSFIKIRERRPGREAAMFTLPRAANFTCIEELRLPTSHRCDDCTDLDSEGLTIVVGKRRLLLPFRLRYPPTPFLAI